MIETISGFFAGVVGTVVGHPLDTVKVRLQTHPTLYLNMVDCMKKVVRSEGFFALFRGIASSMLSLTILNTMAFGIFGETKRLMVKVVDRQLNWADYFVAGSVVGACCNFISTPFEMVKVQLQLDNIEGKRFSGSLNCASYLLRYHGITGLYAGFNSNMFREIIFAGTYFGLYENVKKSLCGVMSPSFAIPIAGGLSGATAWFVSFPLDVIKSMVQSESARDNISKDELTIKQVALKKYREQGMKGFYFGVKPSIIRAFIVSSIRFSSYEFAIVKLSKLI